MVGLCARIRRRETCGDRARTNGEGGWLQQVSTVETDGRRTNFCDIRNHNSNDSNAKCKELIHVEQLARPSRLFFAFSPNFFLIFFFGLVFESWGWPFVLSRFSSFPGPGAVLQLFVLRVDGLDRLRLCEARAGGEARGHPHHLGSQRHEPGALLG